MECKHCGAEVGEEYRLCPYCRSELEYPKQKVIINNYRQYRHAEIEFSKENNKNFTIIQGTNGAGKTTLLNNTAAHVFTDSQPTGVELPVSAILPAYGIYSAAAADCAAVYSAAAAFCAKK